MGSTDTGHGVGRQFHFVRRIGTGGFGEVYLAEMSTASGFTKMVAIKLLKGEVQGNVGVAERMRDEARLLGMLQHRTIVQADDLITLSGRVAVVMEYIPGCNWSAVISPEFNTQPIPPRIILDMTHCVANALDVAYHRPSSVTGKALGVLHRDIKPGNIRVTPDGEFKVLDFGIARSEGINREAHTTEYRLGSLNYMAPELISGGEASPSSDVYSLGVTLYESIVRERFGWAGESEEMHSLKVRNRLAGVQAELFGDVSAGVLHLLNRMLAYDPVERPLPKEVAQLSRKLERAAPGDGTEEWAKVCVSDLQDSEDFEEDQGEFTGRVIFEDDSSAMAYSLHGGGFLEDETMAVGGGREITEEVTEALTRRYSVQNTVILLLLLGVTGMVGWTHFMRQDAQNVTPNRREQVSNNTGPTQAAVAQKPEPIQPILVRLSSNPVGLAVLVDGVPRGATPVLELPLNPGEHSLTFVDGDQRISRQIMVDSTGNNFWKYHQDEGKIR